MPVTIGVPQRSFLGPLCFSLLINDMPLAVKETTVLFADDATFVIISSTLDGLQEKISRLFSSLSKHLNYNTLIPNSTKSKLLMFLSQPVPELPYLTFDDRVIEWVSECKYLGLTIKNTLSFAKHVSNVAFNVSLITVTFVNLQSITLIDVLTKPYYALVFPHLTNHVIVWGSAS